MKHCESCNIVYERIDCPLCVRIGWKSLTEQTLLEALKNIVEEGQHHTLAPLNSRGRMTAIAQAAIDAVEGK